MNIRNLPYCKISYTQLQFPIRYLCKTESQINIFSSSLFCFTLYRALINVARQVFGTSNKIYHFKILSQLVLIAPYIYMCFRHVVTTTPTSRYYKNSCEKCAVILSNIFLQHLKVSCIVLTVSQLLWLSHCAQNYCHHCSDKNKSKYTTLHEFLASLQPQVQFYHWVCKTEY